MTTIRAAAQAILTAWDAGNEDPKREIEALRAALSDPEAAQMTFVQERGALEQEWCELRQTQAQYKSQTPMSNQQILSACKVSENSAYAMQMLAFARAVERHHGIGVK